MSFFFAFFESSAQRCQSSWELGHGINSWCHFGCVTNPPNRVVPQQHTLAISVSAGQHCMRLPQSLTGGRGLSSPAASTRGGLGGGVCQQRPSCSPPSWSREPLPRAVFLKARELGRQLCVQRGDVVILSPGAPSPGRGWLVQPALQAWAPGGWHLPGLLRTCLLQ